jgi:hypothetical protein
MRLPCISWWRSTEKVSSLRSSEDYVMFGTLSLCFLVPHTLSHVSLELYTCTCLVGHVCQRCGPVSRKTVGTMVDVCQVLIDHTIIGKIQSSSLTTLVCYESRCSCSCTEILAFLTMKLELLPLLLSHPAFLTSKHFFSFLSKTHGFLQRDS